MSKQQELLKDFEYFSQSVRTVDALMTHLAERLHGTMTRYNWVGFYRLEKSTRELVLGPHVGSYDPRERLSVDKGLCGTAATTGQTVVANNVAEDPRYIVSAELVKSEIVVPVFVKKQLYGVIDINSYFLNTFAKEDQAFLEGCAALVGGYLEKHS